MGSSAYAVLGASTSCLSRPSRQPTDGSWSRVRRRRSGAACAPPSKPALADDERFADLGARDRNRGILIPILQAAFERRTVSEWVDLMSAHKVPCAPVNDITRALADPQAAARHALAEYEHPALGLVRTVDTALRLDGPRQSPERRPSSASTRRKSSPMCAATRGSASTSSQLSVSSGNSSRPRPSHEQGPRPVLRGLQPGDVYRSWLGHDHRGRQHLVPQPDDEHQPDALQARMG